MNSADNHTPTPWTVRQLPPTAEDPGDYAWILDGPPRPLTTGQFAKEVDAHLACAGPVLYHATQALVTLVHQLTDDLDNPIIQEALTQAQNALATANGTTPNSTA